MSTPIERVDTYANGTIKARGFELDGELHGTWEWFRADGSLMRRGEFDRGVQVGTWETFTRDEKLHKETHFPQR
ncbi:antitoxin component YwqK of YwqJK toxin-antitoxin module [Aurantimicrobium minutum]|uniref:toxin-antitoxin system YwqK family antitoxin n=1 Tax=Aurantimicrobium minutum TaxID=708131 RepID=UPI002475C98E|nr:hypothetical protein [Aurantimicrobium minutum]MDH6533301.1 antitoxin component YwqK of YwqJK toxin-antitoxin module [Aurantimicrobium minutum]